jgi:hypothetical protein
VADTTTRFSDIGVFATLFSTVGASLAAVVAGLTWRAPRPDSSGPEAGPLPGPPVRSEPAPVPTLSRKLREQAEAETPERELLPFAWIAAAADGNAAHAAGPPAAANAADHDQPTAKDIADFLLSLLAPRLLVIGGPDAGKTVLARWLALAVATNISHDLSPIYASVANWRPQKQSFADWATELTVTDRREDPADGTVSRPLLLLDDFDTLSRDRRREVLLTLSRRPMDTAPFVLFTRPEEYEEVARYAVLTGWVAELTLQPLSPSVIVSALRPVTAEWLRDGIDRLKAEVLADPGGPLAAALSSPFMLSRARRAGDVINRTGNTLEASSRDKIEELLVADMVRDALFDRRWPNRRIPMWLHRIAQRTSRADHDGQRPYAFSPNDSHAGDLLGLVAVGAVAWFASRLVSNVIHASGRLFILLLVVHFVCMMVRSDSLGHDPDLDPHEQIPAAVSDLGVRLAAAVAALLFGLLGLLAVYTGSWVVLVPVCVGAVLGLAGPDRPSLRLVTLPTGALLGGIVGVAAHAAAHDPLPSALLASSGLVAAAMFAVLTTAFVINFLSEGEIWLYALFAPVIGAVVAVPVGLVAGCLLVLGAHAGPGGSNLLFYIALWVAALVSRSSAANLAIERLVLAAKGVSPVPLMAFLDDCVAGGVFRRRGCSYEFKHPAIHRLCLRWRHPDDWGV